MCCKSDIYHSELCRMSLPSSKCEFLTTSKTSGIKTSLCTKQSSVPSALISISLEAEASLFDFSLDQIVQTEIGAVSAAAVT